MAKNEPPRPGARPPRPGARPRPGAPPRPSAPPRPEPTAEARRATRPDATETPVERRVAPPTAKDDPLDALEMVPLRDGAAPDEPEAAPATATSFFALPQPKRKKPEEPPAPEPPPAAPPPAPVPPPAPGLGIQGPVASGPVASGPVASGPVASGPVAQGPVAGAAGGPSGGRARSYRVFAVVAGLMFLVFSAMLVAVGLIAWDVWSDEPEAKATSALVPAVQPAPARKQRDTAAPERPARPAEPKPKPSAPATPKPAADPPPKRATGPATAVIEIPADQPFTSVEVNCPGGFRARAPFEGGRATLKDVPREDCTVFFKGGPPARNRISGGQTKTCTFPNAQAVCH